MLLKIGGDKVIVGYDLGNDLCQISYGYAKEGSIVETLSSVAGQEIYDIPAVLCKRVGINQWFFGKEALRYMEENEGGGILVDRLLEAALDGEDIQLEGIAYQPVSLLTLFVKRSLGLLTSVTSIDRVTEMMITCDDLTPKMLEVLNQVVDGLQLKNTRVYYQNYAESMYSYMLYQPRELWEFRAVLFDYRAKGLLRCLSMECNRRTSPVVTYVQEETYNFAGQDRELLSIARKICGAGRVSAFYLLGERFGGGWMEESLKYLCQGRRVFQGSNLYSKGACCWLLEKQFGSEVGKEYVFLGSDKLKANIGMRVLNRGEETYFALLDAGTNWYEAEYTCDLYLKGENDVELSITPLIDAGGSTVKITLDGLNIEQNDMVRIRMKLWMLAEARMCAEFWDLGMGEFRAATDQHWREEIDIY